MSSTKLVEIMRKWCVRTTPELRAILSAHLVTGKDHKAWLTQLYLHRVKQYAPWLLEDVNLLMNGYIYYAVSILFAFCHYSTLEKLHGTNVCLIAESRIIRFSLICLIADHAVDSPELKDVAVKQLETMMAAIVIDPSAAKPPLDKVGYDPRIYTVYILLRELIQEVPAVLPCVVQTLKAELASSKQKATPFGVQPDGSFKGPAAALSYDELLKVEGLKGALVYELLGRILNNGVSLHVPYELGYIIQLCDDLADIYIDQEEQTWTVVWSEIARCGCIDRIVIELVEVTDRLPAAYWPFKLFGLLFAAYIASSTNYVSTELTEIMQPYFPLVHRGKSGEKESICRDTIRKHFEYNVSVM